MTRRYEHSIEAWRVNTISDRKIVQFRTHTFTIQTPSEVALCLQLQQAAFMLTPHVPDAGCPILRLFAKGGSVCGVFQKGMLRVEP